MSNANLGTLNVLSGVSTRVGLPLDYILPMLDKMDERSLYNKQKVSEIKIGLKNIPTISDTDKKIVDNVNTEIETTIKDIDDNDNWSAATGSMIKLAEKLSTDDRLRALNTRVATYQQGEKELSENKDMPEVAKQVARAISQETYNSLEQEDGTIGKFNYFKFNSNVDLTPYQEQIITNAEKINASINSYYDIIATGHDAAYAIDNSTEDPQIRALMKANLLQSSTTERITEEQIRTMAITLLGNDAQFNQTVNDVVLVNTYKRYGTINITKEIFAKTIGDLKNPGTIPFLKHSSKMYETDMTTLESKHKSYVEAINNHNSNPTEASKKAVDLAKSDFDNFSKAVEANEDKYIAEGAANFADITDPNQLSSNYYALNSIPVRNSVFGAANHLAYNSTKSTFSQMSQTISKIGSDSANKTLEDMSKNAVGMTVADSTGSWALQDVYDAKSEFNKQYTSLKNAEKSGEISDDQRVILKGMEQTIQANEDLVKINIKNLPEANQSKGLTLEGISKRRSFGTAILGSPNQSSPNEHLLSTINTYIIGNMTDNQLINENFEDVYKQVITKDAKKIDEFVKSWSYSKDMPSNVYSTISKRGSGSNYEQLKIEFDKRKKEAISKYTKTLNKDKTKITIPATAINMTNYNDALNSRIQNDILTHVMSGTAVSMSGEVLDDKYLRETGIQVGTEKQLPLGAQIEFINQNGAEGFTPGVNIVKVTTPRRDADGKVIQGSNNINYIKYDKTDQNVFYSNLANAANNIVKVAHTKGKEYMTSTALQTANDVATYIGGSQEVTAGNRKLNIWKFVNELKAQHQDHSSRSVPVSFNFGGTNENPFVFTVTGSGDHYSLNISAGGQTETLKLAHLNSIPVILGALQGRRTNGLSEQAKKFILNQYKNN